MRGLFCNTTVKTNEEYKKIIKRRMMINLLLSLAGAVTLVAAILVKLYWKTTTEAYMVGLYSGFGAGLLLASAVLWMKNMRILKNEEKLKESRLINSDERIKEINNRAFRSAAVVLLVLMYGVALIGGIFYPILVQTLMPLICVFLLVYLIAYRINNKRM